MLFANWFFLKKIVEFVLCLFLRLTWNFDHSLYKTTVQCRDNNPVSRDEELKQIQAHIQVIPKVLMQLGTCAVFHQFISCLSSSMTVTS